MNLIITSQYHTDVFHGFEITNGKQTAHISKGNSGLICICNANASHKAWRGGGRNFWNWTNAESAYKSGFMQSAIALAREYI